MTEGGILEIPLDPAGEEEPVVNPTAGEVSWISTDHGSNMVKPPLGCACGSPDHIWRA